MFEIEQKIVKLGFAIGEASCAPLTRANIESLRHLIAQMEPVLEEAERVHA